jgi:hypothetical protein
MLLPAVPMFAIPSHVCFVHANDQRVDSLTYLQECIGVFPDSGYGLLPRLRVNVHPLVVNAHPTEDSVIPHKSFVTILQLPFAKLLNFLHERRDLPVLDLIYRDLRTDLRLPRMVDS